jgi:hypothetical protein
VTIKTRLATLLRRTADRIDHHGAPKIMHWSFTFELGEGIRFREDGKGCRLAFLGDDEYERAHSEADSVPPSLADLINYRQKWRP